MNSPIADLNFQDLRRGADPFLKSVFQSIVPNRKQYRSIHFMIAERIHDEIIISVHLYKIQSNSRVIQYKSSFEKTRR